MLNLIWVAFILVGFVAALAVGEDDVDAAGGELQCGVAAEAAAAAGDQGDFAGHGALLRWVER